MTPRSSSPRASRFTITDLGTLPGGRWSHAYGINDQGQVAGTAEHASGHSRAFLWQNGKMRDLGVVSGSYSTGQAINNKGQVVGESNNRAFVWQGGKMRDIGTLPDGGRSIARSINDNGQVVGDVGANEHRAQRAFFWKNGRIYDLGTLPGGRSSAALSINRSGHVAGGGRWEEGWGNASIQYAFVWERKRGMRDLGTLKRSIRPYNYAFATAINDKGQVVGESDQRAFLWQNGKMRDLGTVPDYQWWIKARDINNQGHVVGIALNPGDGCAFLYADGKMVNLNTLIPPDSGWKLENVAAINDLGQIVGHGKHNGQNHAFLLTPVRR